MSTSGSFRKTLRYGKLPKTSREGDIQNFGAGGQPILKKMWCRRTPLIKGDSIVSFGLSEGDNK